MIIENCDKKENIYVFDFINVTIKGQKIKSYPVFDFNIYSIYKTFILHEFQH